MNNIHLFLDNIDILPLEGLPFVHTTTVKQLKEILKNKKILLSPCNIFVGDNLSYFFVARPAYKIPPDINDLYFSFPVCLILKPNTINNIKRAYPFDSGGFVNNKMPAFVRHLKLEDFLLPNKIESINKFLGAYFPNNMAYFNLKGLNEDDFVRKFNISKLDFELIALNKLSRNDENRSDDRRFALEIQTDENIEIENNLLAVILPEDIMREGEIIENISNLGAEMSTYMTFPADPRLYHYAILERTRAFLLNNGFLT